MATGDISIKIPGEVKRALKIPEREVKDRLKLEFAVHLYEEWLLAFGKAAELAGLSHWDFAKELSKRKIERHYTDVDLKEDLEFADKDGTTDGC